MGVIGGSEVVARSGCQSATWSAAVSGRNVLSQDEKNTSIPNQRPQKGENINGKVK